MTLYVAPRETTNLDDLSQRRYDGLLCSHGYETRSRTVAELLGGDFELKAAGYRHNHAAAFEQNRSLLVDLGGEVREISESEFPDWVASWLSQSHLHRVAIDISSMNRPRIAAVVNALSAGVNPDLLVDFLYIPQIYSGPPEPIDAPAQMAPVIPAFAGWNADVEQPLVMLFGLGYEPIRAAGAIDQLEPDLSVPYFPRGADQSFVTDVETANADVLNLPDVLEARPYRIADPFACFADLDALVTYYEQDFARPLLLPLGPKIFALVCMLVAAAREPATPVWRVSPGAAEEPVDHQPEDMLVTLRVSGSPIRTDEPLAAQWA